MEKVPLRGICGNRGDHASLKDILHVIEGPRGEPVVDFALVCEMHSEQQTMDRINALGAWKVVRGKTKSDCIILNTKTMDFGEAMSVDLLPAGKRFGKYNMEKDATGARVVHRPSKRAMDLWVMHNIQSLYLPIRRAAGLTHNRRFVDAVNPHQRLTIAGMDANAQPGEASMKPFRDANWDMVFPFGTFKRPKARRNIDGFCVDDRDQAGKLLSKPTTHRVIVDGTDHFWVRATWPILVRSD